MVAKVAARKNITSSLFCARQRLTSVWLSALPREFHSVFSLGSERQLDQGTQSKRQQSWNRRSPLPYTMSDNRDTQLPACQKCKFRKVRCDRAAPKCSHCTKGNIACIILDPVTGEQYARDFIRQLEAKERELKRRLCDHGVLEEESEGATAITAGAVDNTSPITTRSERLHQELTEQENVGSAGSYSRFVGDGSGLGYVLMGHNYASHMLTHWRLVFCSAYCQMQSGNTDERIFLINSQTDPKSQNYN